MKKVSQVNVLDGYCLELTFNDGVIGTVNLSGLVGKGVFSLWEDPEAFAAVRIGEVGELAWGDQIDLCPDSLYLQATGQNVEDLFPGITGERSHA